MIDVDEIDREILKIQLGRQKKELAFLEITNIPKTVVMRQQRVGAEKSGSTTDIPVYTFQHLTALRDVLKCFSYEIHFFGNSVSLRLGVQKSRKQDDLVTILEGLKTAYSNAYPGIKSRTMKENELLHVAVYPFLDLPDLITEDRDVGKIQFLDERPPEYFTILVMHGNLDIKANTKFSQIDTLMKTILENRIKASFIVHSVVARRSIFRDIRDKNKLKRDFSSTKTGFSSRPLLDPTAKKKLLDFMFRKNTGVWHTSVYIVIRDTKIKRLKVNARKLKVALMATYSSESERVKVEILRGKNLINAIFKFILREPFKPNMELSSVHLAVLTHLPEDSYPGIKRKEIPEFEVPRKEVESYNFLDYEENPTPKPESDSGVILFEEDPEDPMLTSSKLNLTGKKIFLGNTIWGESIKHPVYLNLNKLALHAVIMGESGFGKTEYVKFLVSQLNKVAPEINWLIFDYKGEYRALLNQEGFNDVTVFTPAEPNNNFALNIFDPETDEPESHANKLFLILYNMLYNLFKSSSEISPQMERILREAVLSVVREVDKNKKIPPIDLLFKKIDDYVAENRAKMPSIVFSAEAIKNRLNRLRQGILKEIFNTSKNQVDIVTLLRKKVIIDLSTLIKRGATLEDTQLLVSVIAKYILDYSLKRGLTEKLDHVTIFEEAGLIIPRKDNSDRINVIEEMALMIRAMGEGLIFVAQRPTISYDILSNTATKIIFRVTVDTDLMAKILNLDDSQEKYLRTLPIGEAIAMIPGETKPFRLGIPKITKAEKTSPAISRKSVIKEILQLIADGWDTVELLHEKLPYTIKELNDAISLLINNKPPLLTRFGMFLTPTKHGLMVLQDTFSMAEAKQKQ